MAVNTDPRTAQVGDELPGLQRATGLANWNRFAAVNHEFVPIHMDDEAGRAAGYPTAFGMGNLQWAYLHDLLRDWLGDSGRIVKVACQFRSPNTKGMTVHAGGTVVGLREEDGQKLVDVEVWTQDQDGNKLAPGTAVVALDA